MWPAAPSRSTSARAVENIGTFSIPAGFTYSRSLVALRLSRPGRIQPSGGTLRCLRIAEGVDHKADDRDADTGIGHVKGRPWVRKRQVQIEEQKIDDMTVQETVGEVAKDAGEKQPKGETTP